MMSCKKLRAHRQLVRGKAQRFACDRFRHAVQLKQNVTRTDCRDPVLGLPFALGEARLRWTAGQRIIREKTDQERVLAWRIASDCDARGLELRVGDPGA